MYMCRGPLWVLRAQFAPFLIIIRVALGKILIGAQYQG